MPISVSPPPPNSSGTLTPTSATAGENIGKGAAVALVDVGGHIRIMLCGALTYGNAFAGFTTSAVSAGNKGTLITGRGSIVRPLVEGGAALVPEGGVFLSLTPGRVTQTPSFESLAYIQRVGVAVSATEMMLLTEPQVRNP